MVMAAGPAAMKITTAVAGLPPNAITSASTNYFVAAKNKTKPLKVTGRIATAMPAGMTLKVTLSAPAGATSNGAVTLDATTRDLVGNITNTTLSTQTIIYVVSATPAAGVVASQSRTVTFTLVAWP
jgi:hypothetical protein